MAVESDGVRAVVMDEVTAVEVVAVVVLVADSVGDPDASSSASFAFRWASSTAFRPCDSIPSRLHRSFLVHRARFACRKASAGLSTRPLPLMFRVESGVITERWLYS